MPDPLYNDSDGVWRPTPRTHRNASLLFGVIGIIFLVAFRFWRGTEVQWFLLGLGVIGCCRSLWNLVCWLRSTG